MGQPLGQFFNQEAGFVDVFFIFSMAAFDIVGFSSIFTFFPAARRLVKRYGIVPKGGCDRSQG